MEQRISGIERQKAYRERLKLKKNYEEIREKNNHRNKQNRDKTKSKLAKLNNKERSDIMKRNRIQNNDRLKKFRRIQRERKEVEFPYKSANVIGKDLKKVSKALPKSPTRKAVILQKLLGNSGKLIASEAEEKTKENSLQKQ